MLAALPAYLEIIPYKLLLSKGLGLVFFFLL